MDRTDFPFRSERLSLDFAATLGERGHSDIERLPTPADLARWTVDARLLAAPPAVDDRQLDQARQLREAVYRCVQAVTGGAQPQRQDIETINRWAGQPLLPRYLGPDGRTGLPTGTETIDQVLAELARDAIDLLSGPEIDLVRQCARPACSIFFVDRSRGHRRRWCSMNYCGNDAKKQTFRSHEFARDGEREPGMPRTQGVKP